MIIQTISAALAVIAFCFVLRVPRKCIPFAGMIGGIGWLSFLLLQKQGLSTETATFFSGCLISLLSQIMARIRKTPVTVFVIPGVLPLVPGAGMYRIAYSIIRSQTSMTSRYLTETFTTAGMLALSVVIVEGIFRLFSRRRPAKTAERTDLPQ